MSISSALAPSSASDDNREASEYVTRGSFLQPASRCKVAPVTRGLKGSIRAVTESMNDTLWLPLAVKVEYFLAANSVFEQHWASRAHTERVGGIVLGAIVCRFNLARRVLDCRFELGNLCYISFS